MALVRIRVSIARSASAGRPYTIGSLSRALFTKSLARREVRPGSTMISLCGESLLAGIDTLKLGYVLTEHVQTAKATHIVLTKRP
jgi:hypothetical protein